MVVITVEYADPQKVSKTTSPMHVEDAISAMRDVCFRVAVGEFTAAYVTEAKPINVRQLKVQQ